MQFANINHQPVLKILSIMRVPLKFLRERGFEEQKIARSCDYNQTNWRTCDRFILFAWITSTGHPEKCKYGKAIGPLLREFCSC